jgi:hypothetical protein
MFVSCVVDEADLSAFFGEAQVCIILTQDETVFTAAGHHTVWFFRTLGDQIINQYADIRFGTR